MPYILVRSKVEDYAKWKPVFDGQASFRKSSGSKGENVFRNADNPNELFVSYHRSLILALVPPLPPPDSQIEQLP